MAIYSIENKSVMINGFEMASYIPREDSGVAYKRITELATVKVSMSSDKLYPTNSQDGLGEITLNIVQHSIGYAIINSIRIAKTQVGILIADKEDPGVNLALLGAMLTSIDEISFTTQENPTVKCKFVGKMVENHIMTG